MNSASIDSIETELQGLDPILHAFCERSGYTFSSHVGVWPRRRVWCKKDVCYSMDLTTKLSVPEIMEVGFHREMPWSLYAMASVWPHKRGSTEMLEFTVFDALPFSRLATTLDSSLEKGRIKLEHITSADFTNT